MRIPTATYRIQFCPNFGFSQARTIVSYLKELGISDIYASPIFQAGKGSQHGYDIVDANSLNRELGTIGDFNNLTIETQSQGLGWLQDIVPNHRAYNSENPMLVDIFEHGPISEYSNYFDINWHHPYPQLQGKILTPLLGDLYSNCLESGELRLVYEEQNLCITYYDLTIPLRIESYGEFFTYNLGKLTKKVGRNHPDVMKLLGILYLLKNLDYENTPYRQRKDQANFIKSLIWEVYSQNSLFRELINDNLELFNGEEGKPESFSLLDNLLNQQFFRLSYWKVGAEELNYRRFFTVNELISLRVEDQEIFLKTHQLISQLVKDEKFTGLRIDHIDGLYNPRRYLEKLKELVGDIYIVVEKILEAEEVLPSNWLTEGTSGYDFLNQVNGIFCKQENEQQFSQIYDMVTGSSNNYAELAIGKKRLMAETNLVGDIDNIAHFLQEISEQYRYGRDFTLSGLRKAIFEVLVNFPVYRTYVDEKGTSKSDREYIAATLAKAKAANQLLIRELNFIEQVLLQNYDSKFTTAQKQQWLNITMKLQQYSGPLMAKGIEDTLFYVYNRLASLNEVGGNPEAFGVSVEEFHQFNQDRLKSHPHSMSTTSTHDTKRSEDVRARLNVLSEIPTEWEQRMTFWRQINYNKKVRINSRLIPDANDEYFFYQNLLGVFPFKLEDTEKLITRLKEYSIKAVREAKIHTAWLRPDQVYEDEFCNFIDKVFDFSNNAEFWENFTEFQAKISFYGMLNSLSQTLLKITSPGVPDFYQGTELWDFSLVDPDNRRLVDYQLRKQLLTAIKNGDIEDFKQNYTNGKIKLFLTQKALQVRKEYLEVFQDGDYLPLEVSEEKSSNLIAFARHQGEQVIITVATRHFTSLVSPPLFPLGKEVWGNSYLSIPSKWGKVWEDTLTNRTIEGENKLLIRDIFTSLPLALLKSVE